MGEGLLPAADQVQESSWSGDYKIGPLLERLDLGTLADATEDRGHRKRHMLGVGSDILLNLDNQFAGRGDNQGADALGRRGGQQR